jgi:flagellar P-ring protein precursor FlgI
VSSLADARSLQGGTLMLTPLYGADEKLYALAQGPLTTGSYVYELNATSVQKNHPTVGMVTRGAILERAMARRPATAAATTGGDTAATGSAPSDAPSPSGAQVQSALILNAPDLTTAVRMKTALAALHELSDVQVAHPGKVTFKVNTAALSLPEALARVEALEVTPDQPARLVVNERTGTLVAGGDIRLGRAVIAQDDLRIEINTEFLVSQPASQFRPGDSIATVTVPKSEIEVSEAANASVIAVDDAATVLDLVNALRKARVPAKSMVSIFQSLREAGALNAQIVVQ